MKQTLFQTRETLDRAKSSIFFSIVSFQEEMIYYKVKNDLEKYFSISSYESIALPKWIPANGEKVNIGKNTKILSFKRRINREELPELKRKCLKICNKHLNKDETLKIIPGYQSEQNVIIASTTDDLHKVYLFHGVYAEVVYIYEADKLIFQTDSPPFFSTKEAIYFFKNLRESFLNEKK